jgi:hypothetical protein
MSEAAGGGLSGAFGGLYTQDVLVAIITLMFQYAGLFQENGVTLGLGHGLALG